MKYPLLELGRLCFKGETLAWRRWQVKSETEERKTPSPINHVVSTLHYISNLNELFLSPQTNQFMYLYRANAMVPVGALVDRAGCIEYV